MVVTIKVTNQSEHYFEIPDEYLAELTWQADDSNLLNCTQSAITLNRSLQRSLCLISH